MPAAVVSLYIQQGETFSRTAKFFNLTFHKATTSAPIVVGVSTVSIATGGTGVILAGDYVYFGSNTIPYLVEIGIADLSLGGVLTLATPLATAFPVGTALKINTIMDLTGCTARAQIGYPVPKTAKELTIPTQTIFQVMATFLCTISVPTGEVTYSLTNTETSAIRTTGEAYNQLTKYQWDFELRSAIGTVLRAFNGPVEVSPEVTKIE